MHRWLTLGVVSVALFLVVIDMTVLYTALPTLARVLETDASEKLWILNSYSLVMAALMPVFGALGDKLGQRRIFILGLLVFALASLLAAFSTHAWMLIGARALLGIGGAAMIPSTIALVRLTFSDPKEQALAIGIWASIASGGAAVGPVLGGFLLEHFWWGSVFLINVPIIAVALFATALVVPNYAGFKQDPIDFASCVLIMAAMVLLSFGIKEFALATPNYGLAVSGVLIGLGLLAVFLKRQLTLPYPLVDLTILKTPAIASGILVGLIASLTLVGFELALSQRLQLVLEKSPLHAGLTILPISLGSFLAGPLAGVVIGRIGSSKVLLAGLALTISGIVGYALFRNEALWLQLISLALLGIGIGSSLTASSALVMGSVPEERAGMAGSVEGMAFEFGAAMGITVFGSLMTAVYVRALSTSDFKTWAGNSLDQAYLNAAHIAQGDALLAHAKAAFESGFVVTCVGAAIGLTCLCLLLARQRF